MNLVLDDQRNFAVWCDRRRSVSSVFSMNLRSGRSRVIVRDTSSVISVLPHTSPEHLVVMTRPAESPERPNLTLSLRRIDQAKVEMATIRINGNEVERAGDVAGWERFSMVYAFLDRSDEAFALIVTGSDDPRLERLSWYRDRYDPMYQAGMSALQILEREEIVFAVQRSNTLVVCDAATLQIKVELPLPGDFRGAHLVGSIAPSRLIATNYDSIVLVDTENWAILHYQQMQGVTGGKGAYFGHPTLSQKSNLLVVPRPFSRDVLCIDSMTFEPVSQVHFDGEPVEAVLTDSGAVYAVLRDRDSLAIGSADDLPR